MGPPPSDGILVSTNIVGNGEKLSNEQNLQHSGRIPYHTFQALIAGSFAIAVLAATARIIVRIRTRRFGLDDCFVLLAIISLSGATGVVVRYTRDLFLVEAMTRNPTYILTIEDVKSFGSILRIASCLPPMTWTATIAVKLSFLVLFRQLVKLVSKKITIYIWVVILVSILTWVFGWSGTFLTCFLINQKRCVAIFSDKRSFALDVTLVSFNMATDMMSDFNTILLSAFISTKAVLVVIIPILILRISQMKFTQKLALATLLCLSIFMVLISAIRMTGYAHHHSQLDPTWTWFWMYIESCVAIIIASISAFSPFFFINRDRVKKADEKEKGKFPLPLDQERVLHNNKSLDRAGWRNMDREGLPAVPLATLTRIHRFLYDDARLMEWTETMHSKSHCVDEESQPYIFSPSTKEIEGKERSYSLIAPA